jgi:hypothetical protein
MLALWPIGLPSPDLAAAGAAAAGAGQRPTERSVFVTVTNEAGAPERGLDAGDFDLREDGVQRTVLRAEIEDGPMRVAVLVDSSEAASQALNHIRSGLQQFLSTLPAAHEIVLVTTGGQLRVHAGATTDRAKLNAAARGIFPDAGRGSVLLDALLETDKRFLDRVEKRWPVFVIVTTDGTESSVTRDFEFNRFVDRVIARGSVVHALVLSKRGGGLQTNVSMNLTRNTGGHYEALAASTALPDRMAALAKLMSDQHATVSGQYRLVYASEAANREATVQVRVAGSGLKLEVLRRRVQKALY